MDFKFSKHLIMAIGGEDRGLPPYIRKFCDSVVKIPMFPEAHSFNASVALSLGLYIAGG
jgi:23S rRNA (guanosine2251-2'-O)-methyltransferase